MLSIVIKKKVLYPIDCVVPKVRLCREECAPKLPCYSAHRRYGENPCREERLQLFRVVVVRV